MHQHLQEQSLSNRQSYQSSQSKKPKSIKSIRIVDKQNLQPHPKQQYSSTARSPSPHEFSFKKQYPTSVPQCSDEYLLKDKLFSQQQQIKKLQRMLKSMTAKLQIQQREYEDLRPQYEEFVREGRENIQFKKEICQLKDLMKELLIEKQNDRMMVFYQDC